MPPPDKVKPPDEERPAKEAPPVKVELAAPVTAIFGVETEEVATRPETEVVPETRTSPWTARDLSGLAVPTPIRFKRAV